LFQGPAEIGRDAFFGPTYEIHGGMHLHSARLEDEESFTRKCLKYRDLRIGDSERKGSKTRSGDITDNNRFSKYVLYYTAIHIFPAGCFDVGKAYDLERLWNDEALFKEMWAWEPRSNFRKLWKLEKRFTSEGVLLFRRENQYSEHCEQYIHFAESGMIEAVDESGKCCPGNSWIVPAFYWEKGILDILSPILKALKLIGGETPCPRLSQHSQQ
jgi:hypothetical protein